MDAEVALYPVPSLYPTQRGCYSLLVASLDMILSNKRITKALIRLHGSAGWSVPLLFANTKTGFLAPRPICQNDVHAD